MELKMYASRFLPTYCDTHGVKLTTKEYHGGYSRETGKPVYHTLLYCPAYSASMFPKLSHLQYRFDEDGDEIIIRYI
jgi:hypothetical protein